MDFRELLKKYIRHVEAREGISFLEDIGTTQEATGVYTGPFTEAEALELRKLDDEAFQPPRPRS